LSRACLGQTNIQVSPIGLGTVKFGRNTGLKYHTTFSLPSDAEIRKLLHVARDAGVNLLDTAPAYGLSEARLGKALKGERQHFVISTKAGEQFINDVSHFDFTEKAVIKSVENSLRALQTDYIDVLLIHSNGDDEKIIHEFNVFATLNQLKQAGKIRSFGMSTKTVAGGKLTVEQADVVMVTYHPLYTEEAVVLEYAAQLKKGVLIKKALGSGALSATDSLPFIFKQPAVSSVIIGTLNTDHLLEAVKIANKLLY